MVRFPAVAHFNFLDFPENFKIMFPFAPKKEKSWLLASCLMYIYIYIYSQKLILKDALNIKKIFKEKHFW